MTTNDNAQWVTIVQAATILGKSERTVRRWATSKRLPIDCQATPSLVDISNELNEDSNGLNQQLSDTERLQDEIDNLIKARWAVFKVRMNTAIPPQARSEIEALRNDNAQLKADNSRLKERVRELEDDRSFLQSALAAALANQQLLLDSPTDRGFRWLWKNLVKPSRPRVKG